MIPIVCLTLGFSAVRSGDSDNIEHLQNVSRLQPCSTIDAIRYPSTTRQCIQYAMDLNDTFLHVTPSEDYFDKGVCIYTGDAWTHISANVLGHKINCDITDCACNIDVLTAASIFKLMNNFVTGFVKGFMENWSYDTYSYQSYEYEDYSYGDYEDASYDEGTKAAIMLDPNISIERKLYAQLRCGREESKLNLQNREDDCREILSILTAKKSNISYEYVAIIKNTRDKVEAMVSQKQCCPTAILNEFDVL